MCFFLVVPFPSQAFSGAEKSVGEHRSWKQRTGVMGLADGTLLLLLRLFSTIHIVLFCSGPSSGRAVGLCLIS